MISWDQWGKLLACNPKLAYGGRMTSVPDHLLEKTCLKAKSAESRRLRKCQLYFVITTDLLFLDQSPRVPNSTRASGPPNSMHVLAHIHRCIIVNYMRHMFDVYTSRDEIRTHEPINRSITV